MVHFELWSNLSSADFLHFEGPGQPGAIPISIYTKHAQTSPYLMHQLLALSALHLSTTATATRDFYYSYATGLQGRALALFNENNPVLEVTPANCVAVFLFSSLLGVQMLCDVLRYQRASLEAFVGGFTNFLTVFRGVSAVLSESRKPLPDAELHCHLNLNEALEQAKRMKGSDYDTLQEFLKDSDADALAKADYAESISVLQQVLDVGRMTPNIHISISVILGWPLYIPTGYIELLRQQRPEALIVLAHYAALLHRGHNLWVIGDGGRFIVESINQVLEPKWHEWLKFPIAQICNMDARVQKEADLSGSQCEGG
jgi:hypothetical protein